MKEYKYDPKYCDDLIEHCENGNFAGTFGATIGVPYRILAIWIKEYLDFSDAWDIGQHHEIHYWEGILQDGIANNRLHEIKIALSMLNLREKLLRKTNENKDLNSNPVDYLLKARSISDSRDDIDVVDELKGFTNAELYQ